MSNNHMDSLEQRMGKSLESYKGHIASIRAGRATPDLLNQIKVEAYNDSMPLNQVATISAQDNSMLLVQLWDKTNLAAAEKAIMTSNLGLNPAIDGDVIRVPLPKLSEERRLELSKVCNNYAEQAKVSIRNIRRDVVDLFKKDQKDGNISEDDMHTSIDKIQKITDNFIKQIDELLQSKKDEIMSTS